MENKKLCCESGLVRVSYKIPVGNFFDNNYTYFTANLKETFIYKDRSRETGLEYGRVEVSYTSFPNPPYYLKAPIELGFYFTQDDGSYQSIDSVDITLPKDQVIGSDGKRYFVGGYGGRRNASRDFLSELLVGYAEFPVHKYSCEILGYTNFPFLDGNCVYPTDWQYFDVKTAILDLRWLKALFDSNRITKPLSNFVAFRECVEVGVDAFNSRKINVAKYAENIDWSKVPLDARDFREYYKNDDIWFKNILTENIIPVPIESPPGCPPPLVKLECCPETGCPEECPPGTCAVLCGDHICCYNKNGKAVKAFYV
jgi:hypothetical protein